MVDSLFDVSDSLADAKEIEKRNPIIETSMREKYFIGVYVFVFTILPYIYIITS